MVVVLLSKCLRHVFFRSFTDVVFALLQYYQRPVAGSDDYDLMNALQAELLRRSYSKFSQVLYKGLKSRFLCLLEMDVKEVIGILGGLCSFSDKEIGTLLRYFTVETENLRNQIGVGFFPQ